MESSEGVPVFPNAAAGSLTLGYSFERQLKSESPGRSFVLFSVEKAAVTIQMIVY